MTSRPGPGRSALGCRHGRRRAPPAEQIAATESADGLALEPLRIASPFTPGVKYNLYSTLSILPRHQERHLWQAEQVHGTGE